jgi:hypothetical protein
LFFLSRLTFIFLNKKASHTLVIEDNRLVMVVMFLKFMLIISPLLTFALRPCILTRVVNGITSRESTKMEGLSNSLRGRLCLGLGLQDRVKVMGVWLMKFYHLFKTFQFACPLMDFNHSKTTSHCNVACFECFSLNIHNFNSFNVSCRQSFNISTTN